jgi:hypothetical protein
LGFIIPKKKHKTALNSVVLVYHEFYLKKAKNYTGSLQNIQTANSKLKNIKDLEEKLMKIHKKKLQKGPCTKE